MKNLINLFVILSVIQNINSQALPKHDYSITLVFNSAKKEMLTHSITFDNYIYKNFIFSKIENTRPKHYVYIDDDGILNRGILPTEYYECCKNTLSYNSMVNKRKKVLKINIENELTYKDFMNISYNNFREILKHAESIYVIDLNEEDKNSLYYTAYEVSF